MAAGPVGIAGGVFGGKALLVIGSVLFTDIVDGVDGAGFEFCSFCGKGLLSAPLPANDSQLSFRGEPMAGAACAVDVETMADRTVRGCISGFTRRSDP